MEDLRYPIGRYKRPESDFPNDRKPYLDRYKSLPRRFREATEGLSEAQLDTPYRPDGWTVRQVVHHVADSHMNGMIRFKLALTEDKPMVKPYNEAEWANLLDSKLPIEVSLKFLEAVHEKWVVLLKSMTDSDFQRIFLHPEYDREFPLYEYFALYAWHGDHHLAHVTSLKERMGW